MRVSVVATGIEASAAAQPRPLHLAGSQAEPARRSTVGGVAQKPATQRAAAQADYGLGNYGQPATSRDSYGQQGLPAGIVPGSRPSFQPSANRTAQPVTAQAPALETAEPSESATPVMGYAAGVAPVSQTATARKLDEQTSEVAPAKPVTQNYQRAVPPVSQPRAQRHGDSFIPPKPVDPRHAVPAAAGDLFAETQTAPAIKKPAAPAMTASQPTPAQERLAPKKAPSLFERFTLRREEAPAQAPAKTQSSTKLSVEEGGKKDEDELDIPAFLRRQAN